MVKKPKMKKVVVKSASSPEGMSKTPDEVVHAAQPTHTNTSTTPAWMAARKIRADLPKLVVTIGGAPPATPAKFAADTPVPPSPEPRAVKQLPTRGFKAVAELEAAPRPAPKPAPAPAPQPVPAPQPAPVAQPAPEIQPVPAPPSHSSEGYRHITVEPFFIGAVHLLEDSVDWVVDIVSALKTCLSTTLSARKRRV